MEQNDLPQTLYLSHWAVPKYSTFQKAISMHVIAHTKPFLFSKYVSHTSLMITRIIAIVSLNTIFFLVSYWAI